MEKSVDRRRALRTIGGLGLVGGLSTLAGGCMLPAGFVGRNLRVGPGEVRRLPASLWRFDTLVIAEGGTLEVVGATQTWMVLDVGLLAQIDGRIVFRNFTADRRTFQATSPSGLQLSHRFAMTNIGGRGGVGARHGPFPGGDAAPGASEHGGGGGSGAWNTVTDKRPGRPGEGRVGGEPGSSGAGGDGGRRRNDNGGLLAIHVSKRGRARGSGTIDLRGADGEAGSQGGRGIPSAVGQRSGGGGGGAPGGEGGVFWLDASHTPPPNWTYLVDGGAGGPGGGAGGRGSTAGEAGEPGSAGYVVRL